MPKETHLRLHRLQTSIASRAQHITRVVQSLRILDQAAGEARPRRGAAGARNHHSQRGQCVMIGAKCSAFSFYSDVSGESLCNLISHTPTPWWPLEF